MYCHLESESYEESRTWGRTSLARCLHVNTDNASWPQHRPPYGLGLNQVIADYFSIEYIEFARPGQGMPYSPQIPNININHNNWHPRARGSRGATQVFQFKDDEAPAHGISGHLTYSQRRNNYRHVFRTRNQRHHVDQTPWHPQHTSRLRRRDLPVALIDPLTDCTWANVAHRATAAEINQVKAGIDTPGPMPRIPASAVRIAWQEAVPQVPDPVLGFENYLAADGPIALPYHDQRGRLAWEERQRRLRYRRRRVHRFRRG